MTLLADSNCRTCKAPVTWVMTPKGGNMPLDPEPVDDGNIWIAALLESGRLLIAVAATHAGVPAGEPSYRSHFASCPDATTHRKKR